MAQDQTINGNLAVSGTADVYGDAFNFGSWTTDSTKFGLSMAYAEDSNQTATLTLSTTRPESGWLWQEAAPNNATGSVPQCASAPATR